MYFTTSWDDGYASDLRIADLLDKYDLTGTFYVCPKVQHGTELLTETDIRTLSKRQEIGAHTMTHPHLTRLKPDDVRKEMLESKCWIERVTGEPCTMFCYPYGDWNPEIATLVKEAGFQGARTTEDLRFEMNNAFAMPVTLQVMPFPFRKRFHPAWKILDPIGPLRARFGKLRSLGISFSSMRNWNALASALFHHALDSQQPFFHLYGHSREIERNGMWRALDEFLVKVKEEGIEPVTNGELIGKM